MLSGTPILTLYIRETMEGSVSPCIDADLREENVFVLTLLLLRLWRFSRDSFPFRPLVHPTTGLFSLSPPKKTSPGRWILNQTASPKYAETRATNMSHNERQREDALLGTPRCPEPSSVKYPIKQRSHLIEEERKTCENKKIWI